MISASTFEAAATALAADGWCLMADFMPLAQIHALGEECGAMYATGKLRPARVGAGRQLAVRGDHTGWLDETSSTHVQRTFTVRMEALRQALNRQLLLALVECEAHYAVYPPGAAYARHHDCVRDSDARVISAVLYLNPAWQVKHGGALRLYLADGAFRDVYPHAGNLLLFRSARFEHEVMPATRQRMSIACWMRQRAVLR